jgi:uncharacterized protein YutE (UPF0331/DUF86 family)
MDSSRIDRYRKKLLYLKRYIDWLNDWMKKEPINKIVENEEYLLLMGIYHTVQSAVACIIDIIAMINKDFTNLVQDNYSNLDYLIEQKIIKKEMKSGIKELIGLRNRLAHDYNGIIDEMAWESIEKNMPFLIQFYRGIDEWLNQQTK